MGHYDQHDVALPDLGGTPSGSWPSAAGGCGGRRVGREHDLRRRVRDRRRRRAAPSSRPSWPRAARKVVVLEQGPDARRRRVHRSPAADAGPPVPGRGTDADGRQPAVALPLGRGHRRHHARQLGDVLPDPGARARAVAHASSGSSSTPSSSTAASGGSSGRCRSAEVAPELAGRNAAVAPPGRRAARLVARVPEAEREGMRRLGGVRVRLPDVRQAAHRASPTCRERAPPAPSCSTGTDARRHADPPRPRPRASRRGFPDGSRVDVKAPRVIVAAGTIHTPLLLARERHRLALGTARAQPVAAPCDRRHGADGRGRRHGARRPAELLRRRVRRATGSCSRRSPARRRTRRCRCR